MRLTKLCCVLALAAHSAMAQEATDSRLIALRLEDSQAALESRYKQLVGLIDEGNSQIDYWRQAWGAAWARDWFKSHDPKE